jgi:hypothetical protein
MTKSNITQYDNVAANNTDVEDVPLGENLMFPADVNNAFREVMADLADVNDGTVSLTSPSAVSLGVTGDITVGGTVDGRDVATDGTKLDGIEALADVTDTANVTSAGAAMLTGATFTGSITAPDATFNGDTAIKLPAGTDAQRPTGVNGMLRYSSENAQFEGYADGAWGAIAGGGEASLLMYNYTATAGQTTFSGADDNSATLSYTADNIIVTLNGVVLENGTDYTATDGTSIVLTTGAALDDELNIIAFKSFTVSDTVAASTGGTFNGSVAVNGDLTVNTIGAGDAAFRFDPDNNCVRPHDASTNGATDNFLVLGASSNRFKDLYLGGGVFLGGTGDANKLDDYEEGTWTPTYTSSNPPTISYAVQNGEYVKIGRQVIARCEITTNSVSGGSGNVVSVGGLPFTANSSAGTRVGTAIIGYATAFSGDSPQAGYQNNNTTSFILGHNSTSTNANSSLSGTLAVTNLATGSNSNFLMATIIYTTT